VIRWFGLHPTAANLLMIAIATLGLASLQSAQRESLPAIKGDRVSVVVEYRGATPAEVEDAICRRLEDALESTTNLEELRCESVEGKGTATVVMKESATMTRFLDDITAAVDGIDNFPAAAQRPVVSELGRTDAVVSLAITGPANPVTLKAYAEQVKGRLAAVGDIADVTIAGFSDHQLRVEVPLVRLRQYGLSLADVANAFTRNSVGMPVGRLEGELEDILLRFDDRRQSIDTLRGIPLITTPSGATIRLGDIAKFTDRFDRPEKQVMFNGKRAALLNITKTRDQDILKAHAAVVAFVEAERSRAPAGVALVLTQDASSVVQDRLDMLLSNGGQGLILVFAVLWLFFSMRYSFWVTMGLPVSFLGALFVLPLLGVTVNMISMVGLLIGIGLLMDDAIVIAENIAARMARGVRPVEAAVGGTLQVLPGITSSFVTTLLVFGSLAFISGEMGQILRVIPIVLITVLTVSLFEAFLILPNHLAHSLSHMHANEPSRFRASFERGFMAFRERYFGPLLDRAVDYRYATLGIALMLVLVAISVPIAGGLKFVGFPELDGDVIEARVLLPQGSPLHRTESVVAHLQHAIERVNTRFKTEQPDEQDLIRNATIIMGENPDAFEQGPHVARVVIDVLSAEVRATRLDLIKNAWREETGAIADVISIAYTEPATGPGGRAIDVRFTAQSLDSAKLAARDFQAWLSGFAGVMNIADDLRPGKREFRLTLKSSAGALGVDARTVAEEVRAAFQGIELDSFPVGPETFDVNLRLAKEDRAGIDDLERFTVVLANGAQVPLPALANIETGRGWARIHRIDGQRAVSVQADIDGSVANANQLLTLAQNTIFKTISDRYPGVVAGVEGQSAASAETSGSLIHNMALGMIGVYLLLSLQFRGYAVPLTVLVVIPTALIGVVGGHLLQGLDISMPSLVGMASLFGVVVNDAILLVVFIREAADRGVPTVQAAKEAGRARFRPIVLTSVTTIAGLTPLLAETSLQAQILIPLASALAFGLTTATVSALFLVPATYAILDDLNLAKPRESEHDEPVGHSSA
jgi:HAE1 family hydrophobic/amphiphilic exporter-1